MNKEKFIDELYVAFPNDVVRGRESVLMPIVLLLAGVAILFAGVKMMSGSAEALRYAALLAGVSLLLIGLIFLVVRLCNRRGLPYYARTNKPLKFAEMSFSKDQTKLVTDLVNRGDIKALRNVQQYPISAVAVMVFTADNDEFVAMQAYSYAELDYHPLTAKIYKRA